MHNVSTLTERRAEDKGHNGFMTFEERNMKLERYVKEY
jgi:hypothetical protein